MIDDSDRKPGAGGAGPWERASQPPASPASALETQSPPPPPSTPAASAQPAPVQGEAAHPPAPSQDGPPPPRFASDTDPVAAGEPVALTWDRGGTQLVMLSLLNLFLRIITLNVYNFWAKTEVRKRIWSSVRLQGEPLEYTGTGKELFLGFLIIFGIVVLPILIVSFVIQIFGNPVAVLIFNLTLYIAVALLIGMGIYRAQRFRLSRTRWRGIHASMKPGGSMSYGWFYLWTAALIPITAGWIIPWRTTELNRRMVNAMTFGNRPLRFTGDCGPLYRRYWAVWFGGQLLFIGAAVIIGLLFFERFKASRPLPPKLETLDWVIVVVTLVVAYLIYAFISAWYRAGIINYFASQTRYGRAHFAGRATGLSLAWLDVSNFLIAFLSLGALAPIAQARTMRYYAMNLSVVGAVPFDRVGQNEDTVLQRGEGLAQAFDIDAFG